MSNEDSPALEPSSLFFKKLKPEPLISNILKELEKLNVQYSEVMQLYPNAKVRWKLPPRYSTNTAYMKTKARLRKTVSVREISTLCLECFDIVVSQGFDDTVVKKMTKLLGSEASDPLLFTRSGKGEMAGKLFLIEFTVANYARCGVMHVYGNSCYMRIRNRATSSSSPSILIGLYDVKCRDVQSKWMTDMLYGSRGYIEFPTFDVIDRCYLWLSEALSSEVCESVKYDLLRLKLQQSSLIAYEFEQAIHKQIDLSSVNPLKVSKPFVFTDEELLKIKSIWIGGDCPDYETYKKLYSYVVPMFLDQELWKTIFQKEFVTEDKFCFEDVDSIDRRLSTLTEHFKKMQEERTR